MDLITYLEFQTYHKKEFFWKYYTYRFILPTNFLQGNSSRYSEDNEQVSECVFVREK